MHVDPYIALAGLIVGFVVGMTGMGGGALMTPILVLLFKVDVGSAVTSDLLASLVMKPIGGSVHIARKTVQWDLVRLLAIGSVPGAIIGTLIVKAMNSNANVENDLKIVLGSVLVLAAATMVLKAWLQGQRSRRTRELVAAGKPVPAPKPLVTKPAITIAIGLVGGTVVGMTSVGSGSLIIVMLMLLYPMLKGSDLVGTDLVQAIPLVGTAAIAHLLLLHDFQIGLTASILVGCIPGVYIGAHFSSRAPDGVIRPALVFVLLASGLKLIGVSTSALGWMMLVFILVALPIWGAVDASGRPEPEWAGTVYQRRSWIRWQAYGAPFGVGFVVAIAYFVRVRPRLEAARHPASAPIEEPVPAPLAVARD